MTEPLQNQSTGANAAATLQTIDPPTEPVLTTQSYQPSVKQGSPIGVAVLTVAMLMAAIAGGMLARIAPVTAFDWIGLLKGRNPKEVLVEGLGRKLTQPYQILVLGVDRVPDAPSGSPEIFNGRSDTILLVRFDPKTRDIRLLSIPRDTKVNVPGFGMDKINAANVYGAAPLATATVSEALNGVRIDRYVRVSRAAIVDLVDALGGVEVNVPSRLHYVDHTQKLNIDLQPGLQKLNGEQAEGFARFRHDEEGDIGRIKRQQMLLKDIQAKLDEGWTVTKLPQLIGALQRNLDTNLSLEEMTAIATFSLNLKPDQIHTTTLTGRPSSDYEYNTSYWLVDSNDIANAIDGKFVIGDESEL